MYSIICSVTGDDFHMNKKKMRINNAAASLFASAFQFFSFIRLLRGKIMYVNIAV